MSPADPSAASRAVPEVDPRGEPERLRTSRTQRRIAERMLEATAQVPTFTVRDEVDVAPLVALREGWDSTDPGRPTINDLVIRASALTLREHPAVNSSWSDGTIERFPRVHIGIAVATDELLLVPTVRDADSISVRDLTRETRRLVAAVRGRSITPEELSGATFTVSNLGMFGIADFDAIIAPPQAAILAVAAARRVPVVDGDRIVPGSRMGIRLTCDHRVVYGADGARFMRSLTVRLEQPEEWAEAASR